MTGIGIMVFSIIMTAGLVIYQRQVYKRTGSLIIQADSLHYITDLLMNLSIIISLLLVMVMGWVWGDAVLAILIALYILTPYLEVGRRAF